MNDPNRSKSSSRRHFLRDASIVAAATGMAGIATHALAGTGSSGKSSGEKDQVNPIDLGLRPALESYGVVIVPKSNLVFATFPATSDSGPGMAVVELSGCAAYKMRASGDEATALHPIIPDTLAMCETFEVTNSSWVADQSSQTKGNGKSKLRHFIFTFFGVDPGVCTGARHFECLAEDLHAELIPSGPFGDVLEYIELLDAGA